MYSEWKIELHQQFHIKKYWMNREKNVDWDRFANERFYRKTNKQK